jgi:hypothetical protein
VKSNSVADSITSRSHEIFNDTERELLTYFCAENSCNSDFPIEVRDLESSVSNFGIIYALAISIVLQTVL